MDADIALRLGKEFDNLEEAWRFWNEYAYRVGFSARKNGSTKSKKDKKTIIGYRYACSKEGRRKPDKRCTSATNHRPETRTDCKAGMTVKLVEGKFKIIGFIEQHNHPLHLQETVHMMRSQRKINNTQADEIDLARDAGLRQKATYDLMCKQAGGQANLGFTRVDMKNYLMTKRRRSMEGGEVRCLLKYFEEQIIENPSFYHSYQLDLEDHITNIFWADARMLIDYAYFGDVVSLDTTYCTNNNHRPLAIFSGFNHYRGIVIFGAALLYDETTESFKWLLETFLKANKQKRPATVFTDQDQAMARALREVIPEVKHALCTWHIEQNGIKHLGNKMKGDSHFLCKFNKCMFAIEDKRQFEETWASLISSFNLEDNSWMKSIYEIKEKWAWCYMKYFITLGMRSTQISESVNAEIKNITNPSVCIDEFFKNFEKVVTDKRYNEMKCEYEAREKKPRLIVQSSPILRQVAQIYTAPVLELFQEQFDLFFATSISSRDEKGPLFTYIGTMINEDKKWTLTFDPKDHSVWCSCRHFESIGILCCHALKVYEAHEVRKLPEKYILKRWTKDARDGVIHDITGSKIQEDPKLQSTQTYQRLCHMMITLAAEISNCPETSAFVHNSVIELHKKARDFRSRLRNSNDDDKMEEDRSKEKGGNREKKNTELKDKQPKGIKKRDGTRRKKRFRSWGERLANRSLAKKSCKKLDTPVSCSAPTTLQKLPQVQSFTSMLMTPLDCPTPSMEALEREEFLLSGEGSSSIIASTMSNHFMAYESPFSVASMMSNQFLACEGPSSTASTMFNQHQGLDRNHLQ